VRPISSTKKPHTLSLVMAEEYTKITNEEVERAFREAAVFLFGLYKKYKQNKQMEQDDAA